jgi:exodeoxyribonuclease V alpha subunit
MLEHLDLAYALTIHKAQGSQWPRIIIPVMLHRLLDRSLIYTAITRARRQALLVGDEAAAREAVVKVPRAQRRMTGLLSILKAKIEALTSR